MPDDLRGNWCNNNRNKVHSKCNVLESSWNHLPNPGAVAETSSTKQVPDAKNIEDRVLTCLCLTSLYPVPRTHVGWIPPPSPSGDGLSRQCLFLPGVRRVQSGPTPALPSSLRENQHVALQTLTCFLSQPLLPLIVPCPVKSLEGATWMVAFFHQQEARLHVLVPGGEKVLRLAHWSPCLGGCSVLVWVQLGQGKGHKEMVHLELFSIPKEARKLPAFCPCRYPKSPFIPGQGLTHPGWGREAKEWKGIPESRRDQLPGGASSSGGEAMCWETHEQRRQPMALVSFLCPSGVLLCLTSVHCPGNKKWWS